MLCPSVSGGCLFHWIETDVFFEANCVDPDEMPHFIWVFTVCLCPFFGTLGINGFEMGSFLGHIDEGIFFILLSLWWCYKIFTNYIRVGCCEDRYSPRISYTSKLRGRDVPLELWLKVLFPIAAFLGEFFDNGAYFIDHEGHFRKLIYLQHMSIYGAFIVHSLADLAEYHNIPGIKGTNYMSGCLAFFWYGYGFYFHAVLADDNKLPLENLVHLLPIPVMLITVIAGIVEFWLGEGHIWPQMVRTWGVLNLGTWFTQAAFVLFTPTSMGNPAWDQRDHRNIQAMVAIFGAHLVLNLVLMAILYSSVYLVMWLTGKINSRTCYEYKVVDNKDCKKMTSDCDEKKRPEEMINLIENEV